jgi:Arc/MetJ family transcription regulator
VVPDVDRGLPVNDLLHQRTVTAVGISGSYSAVGANLRHQLLSTIKIAYNT